MQLMQAGASAGQAVNKSEIEHVMFKQSSENSVLSKNWVIIDSASTVNTIANENLVTHIRWSKEKLNLLTGGGNVTINMKANFHGIDVWFDPKGVANILSLGLITDLFPVVFDSQVENALFVKMSENEVWKFERFGCGLYYYDVAKYRNANNVSVTDYSFITTVDGNKAKYQRREIEAADTALEVHARLNRPSQQQFEHILTSNQLRNCPVTVEDVRRAFDIYGPDVATVKGKTVKKKNLPAPTTLTT